MNNIELDKKAIQDGFNRAAHSYDQAACLQREVAERLLERLAVIKYRPKTILDLGIGTGECSLKLAQMYPEAKIIGLDLAYEMVEFAKHKLGLAQQKSGLFQRIKSHLSGEQKGSQCDFICADAESLPLQDNSIDLIFSSLTIQWCEDLQSLFQEFNRVLSPDGFILFSTFGIDTLKELKKSWAAVDDYGHVNEFSDLHDIGDQMLAGGFRDPVVDAEFIVVEYNKVIQLLKDLKAIGAQNHLYARPKGLMTKTKLNQMLSNYESFVLGNGKYPATYEVVYGHAWGRDLSLSNPANKLSVEKSIQMEQLVELKR